MERLYSLSGVRQVKTGSKLAQQIETEPFRNILEAMELLAGPREAIYPPECVADDVQ